MEGCLQAIQRKVTVQMNDELCKDISITEVEEALKQMSPLKSHGPDGFGARFFQDH